MNTHRCCTLDKIGIHVHTLSGREFVTGGKAAIWGVSWMI